MFKASHHIHFLHRLPSPILAFQDHAATFETLQGMPLPYGDAEAADVATGFNEDSISQSAFVIVIEPFHLATEHYHGLGGVAVTVDGHHRARLQGVQHALALVIRRIAQVEVHPLPRRGFRLCRQGVEELLVDEHL